MSNSKSIAERQKTSFLYAGNAEYLEELYDQFLDNPGSVSPEWQSYFKSLQPQDTDKLHKQIRAEMQLARPAAAAGGSVDALKQAQVWQLIHAYRNVGHYRADIDPLKLAQFPNPPQLQLSAHGLSDSDLNSAFNSDGLPGSGTAPLRHIVNTLQNTYCNTIGFEYIYMGDGEQISWLKQKIESMHGRAHFDKAAKLRILNRLTAAEGLEKYLATRYVGQKRFGLDGGESLIPMLDEMIQRLSLAGMKEAVFAMAHRGRLNVLVNVLGRPPADIFHEFEGKKEHDDNRSGDVKYHLGYSSNIHAAGGNMHLTLGFNPSHLEIISPVVVGSVRARQHYWHDKARNQTIPIQIHGDAAFAGQGVVMETLNMSQLRGYETGGSIHIVINNQIGFTISNPKDARSSVYCTDLAKMIDAPIFHVNGDDPEAVLTVAQLAVEYRMKFNRDVVIDLMCYRRFGHNEADEPSATQPMMYKKIRALPSTLSQYTQRLIQENVVTQAEADQLALQYRDALDQGKVVLQTVEPVDIDRKGMNWAPFLNQTWRAPANTGIPMATLQQLAAKLETLPADFTLQPQVRKMMDDRKKMTAGEIPVNWGYAEAMAFASLLVEDYHVRISGQDSGRGTFAHRHANLHEFNTGECYTPLQHLSDKQATFTVVDSFLSENAVLAFEYGYASTNPNALVIWEAQYGDFANGAQVVIDQFISSADQKWGRLCSLIMLLPHGYEGSGPEHSSARLERYLQLCAQENMQVCVPTMPSQIFHLLRRQMIRPFRKPLIIMSPKSHLRHKLAVSTLQELTDGSFANVIPEIDALDNKKVTRLIFCSGKVYFDLLEHRRAEKLDHIALVRIEQLYPFPEQEVQAQFKLYPKATEVIWCQEEPKNQGAWYYIQNLLLSCLAKGQTLQYIGRKASASPAVGYMSLHLEQQAALIKQALGD